MELGYWAVLIENTLYYCETINGLNSIVAIIYANISFSVEGCQYLNVLGMNNDLNFSML